MNGIVLGFGPSPRPVYVYAAFDKNPATGWYTWDSVKDEAVPVAEQALTGHIIDVSEDKKEFKGKENRKLRVSVKAGPRTYIIETGFYTAMARCILAALSRLQSEHFDAPLAIELRAGDEKAVFAEVYNATNGGRIKYKYPSSEADVDNLYRHVVGMMEFRKGKSEVTNGNDD